MEKYCKRCNTWKNVSSFSKNTSMCKKCDIKRALDRHRTKDGLIADIYNGQRKRNKVTYSLVEFKEWIYSQMRFHELFDIWKNKEYDMMLIPSVDRKNPNQCYSLGNIQLLTWQENKYKGYEDRKSGLDLRNTRKVKYYIDGIEVAQFASIMIASRELNIKRENIKNSLIKGHKEGGKRIWVYAD